jgi:hypothetical protein
VDEKERRVVRGCEWQLTRRRDSVLFLVRKEASDLVVIVAQRAPIATQCAMYPVVIYCSSQPARTGGGVQFGNNGRKVD